MSIAKHIPDNIKRVSRSIGYALWTEDAEHWFGLIPILQTRLSEHERALLAFIALNSVKPDSAASIATAVFQHAGMPIAPLFNHMDEAAFWSDMASSEELEAYCLASFTKLPRGRQAAFLHFVQGRPAA